MGEIFVFIGGMFAEVWQQEQTKGCVQNVVETALLIGLMYVLYRIICA